MNQNFLKKIKRNDRMARWVITAGGVSIIFSVILILFLITKVTIPLFQDPTKEVYSRTPLPEQLQGQQVLAVGVDDYFENSYLFTDRGTLAFLDAGNAEIRKLVQLSGGAQLNSVTALGNHRYALSWSDEVLSLLELDFPPFFDADGKRTIRYEVKDRTDVAPPDIDEVPMRSLLAGQPGENLTRIDLLQDGRILIGREAVETDLFGNEEQTLSSVSLEEGLGLGISALVADGQGRYLYAGTHDGKLLSWDIGDLEAVEQLDHLQAFSDRRRITALALVFGDISLAVGDEKGGVSTWFPVVGDSGKFQLKKIHVLEPHRSAVTAISPSQRDKSLLSLDEDGIAYLDHMTSERHLLSFFTDTPLRNAALSVRGHAMIAANDQGQLSLWKVDNPHPEVSFKTLFGSVWYESYPEPDRVWQSSSGSDDFEAKFSLAPLIFGTLKGTFYAMIFAIPLALGGAIYTSQFCNARFRQYIKPTVEIMAAIPSVIIGFLAALWLAPLIEDRIVSILLGVLFVPLSFVVALVIWQALRRQDFLKRFDRGYEFLMILPVVVLTAAIVTVAGPLVEQGLFGGNFQLWLYNEAGMRYDQRNSIIIAFALGFAVIPIIFTIAEDALSNVPPSLKAASLAMGASRWQTVWRVMLPSASPGIFAAIMIGLGRAIGETMIVLMATGNTPIIDMNLFNGMRPLSSNIAVEIPEAPVGGTLYRVLFLSAVILFAMTFAFNTIAEIVRQRLRVKYGRF